MSQMKLTFSLMSEFVELSNVTLDDGHCRILLHSSSKAKPEDVKNRVAAWLANNARDQKYAVEVLGVE